MAPRLILMQVVVPQAVLFPIAVLFARIVKRRSPPLVTLFAFPACWTAFEYFICVLSPNGRFGSFGYSQVSAPVLIQDDLITASTDYAAMIRRAATEGARFVVASEGGLVSTVPLLPAVLAPIVAVSKQTGAQVFIGVNQVTPPADVAFSIEPDGAVQRYAKRHLVPVLEDRFSPNHGSGWIGHGRAMEICKDMDFPTTIRRDAAKGVRLMGVPAGDFDRDAWIHGRMAIMRGVEDGFTFVRAASNGLVTVSDAQGRVIASRMDSPAGPPMVVADVPLGPGPTFYTMIGDAFDWACAVFACGVGGFLILSRNRAVRQKRDPTNRPGALEHLNWRSDAAPAAPLPSLARKILIGRSAEI